jgi:ribonuclease P protein subunit POP4
MTPKSLVRHELAGLDVEVEDATAPELVGIAGRVVDETMQTLLVATSDGVKQVPKAAATFRFQLDDCEAPGASNTSGDEPRVDVIIDGSRLVARPARRTETQGGSLWQ